MTEVSGNVKTSDGNAANLQPNSIPANPAGRPSENAGSSESAGSDAAASASGLVEDAKNRAASLADKVTTRVVTSAEDRKEELAEELEDVAKAVHRSGEELKGHQDWVAGIIERGADELGSLASTLRDNDLKALLGKIEDLARRQPAVFLGASIAAGFAMVRLGKVVAAGASQEDLPHAPEVHRERE